LRRDDVWTPAFAGVTAFPAFYEIMRKRREGELGLKKSKVLLGGVDSNATFQFKCEKVGEAV